MPIILYQACFVKKHRRTSLLIMNMNTIVSTVYKNDKHKRLKSHRNPMAVNIPRNIHRSFEVKARQLFHKICNNLRNSQYVTAKYSPGVLFAEDKHHRKRSHSYLPTLIYCYLHGLHRNAICIAKSRQLKEQSASHLRLQCC